MITRNLNIFSLFILLTGYLLLFQPANVFSQSNDPVSGNTSSHVNDEECEHVNNQDQGHVHGQDQNHKHESCDSGEGSDKYSRGNHNHQRFESFMPEGHMHGEGIAGTLMAVFKNTLMVVFFVVMMMLLLEYVTVKSGGRWNRFFMRRGWMQIILAAILGALPGCMGTYVAVSLYVHRLFSFAALVTVMIATSGDEAFIMIGVMPQTALIIFGILIAVAIISGFLVQIFMKNRSLMPAKDLHFEVHYQDPHCSTFERELFLPQLRKISFERALLISGSLLFVVLLLSGELGLVSWTWTKLTFLLTSLVGLAMFITVPDHFLTKHLWGHVIRKHFLKVFLWTFAAFLLINIIIPYLDLEAWLHTNTFYILLIAVLIGIIPESGPHIIFIILFLDGNIPLSILLANSIVQDGHGALPLLAESRKSFVAMKAVNLLIGFLTGLAGYFMGW